MTCGLSRKIRAWDQGPILVRVPNTRTTPSLYFSVSGSLCLHSLVSSVFAKTKLKDKMENETPPFKIILGSSSIARRKILAEMGYEFTLMSADIDEKGIRKEKPEELVMALAEAKADSIVSKLQPISNQEKDEIPTILIAADTVVVYEGTVREKPANEKEAREFIKVTNLKTGFRKGEWDRVEIYFHEIPDEIIEKLIEEGTVLHVAGGLIIEHPLIKPYVKQVVGTTDSVMGLPKALTEKLIKEAL
ncbi:hypothetical protein DITRI_Ditri03aG0206200 [Diplodiscus trichospermus]